MATVGTTRTQMASNLSTIVLASGSPRRAQLLRHLGFDLHIQSPDVDETWPTDQSPEVGVTLLAQRKLAAIAPQHQQRVVLAADTVVALDGTILGKPQDEAHAVEMLTMLAGKRHQVWTGCCMQLGSLTWQCAVCTQLTMRPLQLDEIRRYVATNEPMDKAGACCIQGMGGALIDTIEGSYTNVIGLPLQEVLQGFTTLVDTVAS